MWYVNMLLVSTIYRLNQVGVCKDAGDVMRDMDGGDQVSRNDDWHLLTPTLVNNVTLGVHHILRNKLCILSIEPLDQYWLYYV